MNVHQSEKVEDLAGDTSFPQVFNVNDICRVCGNHNEKLTGIYSEEGIQDDLPSKINIHLHIKVSENDILPLNCCWHCISTILAWHDFVVASSETDKRLRSCQILTAKQIAELEEENFEKINSGAMSNYNTEESIPVALIGYYHPKSCESKENDEFNEYESNNSSEKKDLLEYHQCSENYEEVFEKSEVLSDESSHLENEAEEHNAEDNESKEIYNFACQYCSSMFVLEEDIINHMSKEHMGCQEGEEFDLEDNEEDANKKSRQKHNKVDPKIINDAKIEVDGKIYYNCHECGKNLHSPYTYAWHIRIHTGERPYVCDLCGKQFRVAQGLVRHLRETHEGIKNFPCDLCGRMFATKRNATEHRRIHTNERPYVCDLCGKSFKQKASLFVHNRSHTNLFPYKCSYCDQGFRTKPPLLVHVTKHTGEKPYACETCGRCFRIKYELKRHRLIHSDEKPFICLICGLRFRQRRYLRNHHKINHNDVEIPIE